jgi:hypothetical protein
MVFIGDDAKGKMVNNRSTCVQLLKGVKWQVTHVDKNQRSTKGQRALDLVPTRVFVYVTPPKLTSANPVESLAIYPFKPTCD